jgi:AraC family transcriptional regulator
MEPRMTIPPEKKFMGMRLPMSISSNRTYELWKSFMPERKEIRNNIGTDLYSIEIYSPGYFDDFNPDAIFEKWAAIEVKSFDRIPLRMETITSPAGLYAVFVHRGPASEGLKMYNYIFNSWLPNSDFMVDNRPHFAIMGEKYKNDDPNSEEEIWIPVRLAENSDKKQKI